MSVWGVGPRIFIPAVITAALGGAAAVVWPQHLVMRFAPLACFLIFGSLMIASGILLLRPASKAMELAVEQGRLETAGAYACTRNPMYSIWIFLLIPGLAVVTRAWPIFGASLVALALFLALRRREERLLEARFGAAFLDYKRRVPLLLPHPWAVRDK